jgi:hypothetical protein
MPSSALTFLLIEDGSMSTWIFFEKGENASRHREVRLVGAVHAEHAEELRVGARVGAEPHQGRGDRESGQAHELAQSRDSLRA